ncbi:MAG: UDP-N-acetylmuramate--L-alanine ligase, UDP-N-acetylmuramate--alanine ligase [Candidatus Parcubacteria bacterium]|jgi:UDP-N-acetylmuramate--alanine ligase
MSQYKHVHFIGIGGIGMSGLARLFLHEGVEVSGSDAKKTANTQKLETEGATVFYTQVAENLESKGSDPLLDLVVYTEAMAEEHPELVRARELGIKTVNYFEALGEVANEYYLIAVAGTHGKTTTTAMLIDIFEEASFDPTAIVGSLRSKTGSNYRAGRSKYFIVEACEYKRDFLTLKPDILVITNIELEHVDYYKDLSDVQSAFKELASRVGEDGAIIADTTSPSVVPVLTGLTCNVIDYRSEISLSLRLRQPGLHTRQNAACASAVAMFVGIEAGVVHSALENFAGTARRFEYKGDCSNAPVYDDYAHHPTELKASIAGARELYPDKKLTVVFQPHTFSRTTELFADFVNVLTTVDRTFLIPVYAARSEEGYTKTSEDIVSELKSAGVDAEHFMTHEACALAVKELVGSDDVVLVMGAGDVTKIASALVETTV